MNNDFFVNGWSTACFILDEVFPKGDPFEMSIRDVERRIIIWHALIHICPSAEEL